MIDGMGTTSFKHTAAGRFEDENGPWSSDRVSYRYNSAGQRTRMSVVGWVQDYHYDGAQRLDRIQAPSGTFQYTYPTGSGTLSRASRQWERLALPGGHEIRQSYDTLARLTKTTLRNSSGQPLNRHEYRFNARHQRDRQTFLAGNTIDYDYDPNGQLTSAMGREANSALRLHEQLTYDYDSAWNLRERTRNELTTQLANNRVNELTSGTRSGTVTASGMSRSSLASVEANGATGKLYADHTYAIPGLELPDGSTDLLTKGTDGGGQTFHHLSLLKLPVAVTYQYDANGNLISDGERNFEYDAENRLIRYEEQEKIQHRYTYDGFNRMRQRTTSVWEPGRSTWQMIANTQFIYDGMSVVQERDALNGGTPQVTYTRGLDLSSSLGGAGGIGGMLAYTDHSTGTDLTAYYHADGNGNITAMINGAGRVVARYHYDPYGNMLGMSGPLALDNRYRYSSKEAQPGVDIYNYGYRFYDPSLQRWINQDPIGEAGGINLYGFVGNDPVNRVDPWGLTDGDLTELGDGMLRPGMLIDPYFDDPRNPGNPITGSDLAREVGGEVVWAMIPGGLGKAKNLKNVPSPPSSWWTKFRSFFRRGAKCAKPGVEGKLVVRTSRDGSKAVRVTRPDGSVIDISQRRVKEFIPANHPKAPPGTLDRVKFDNALPGSKGYKRKPTPEELNLLRDLD